MLCDLFGPMVKWTVEAKGKFDWERKESGAFPVDRSMLNERE